MYAILLAAFLSIFLRTFGTEVLAFPLVSFLSITPIAVVCIDSVNLHWRRR